MLSLRKERVSRSTPFKTTGLDYLRPLVITEGQQTTKLWVISFTYLLTRAIQLEWIIDLSARKFLNGLRRFIARRVRPNQIISDNAPPFRLTHKLLTRPEKVPASNEVMSYLAPEGIT